MLNRRGLIQGAGAVALAGSCWKSADAAASFQGAADIQKVIDERVAAKKLPGAIVSLGRGKAATEYVAGGTLEFESSVKVDENTIWRLASMTKPVAGMAAMILVGEGKLKIDQPVADFIPGFAKQRVATDLKSTETRPAARQMTLRHLVTHTSGLVSGNEGAIGEATLRLGLGGRAGAAPGAAGAPQPMAPPQTHEDWANRIAQVPLAADPGAKWIYGSGLDVVARIIEVVSGQPFAVFLEQRIFAPLGMRSTAFFVQERDKARLVTSYSVKDGNLVPGDRGATTRLVIKPARPSASGGLVSTARDYDRFMAMVENYGTLDGTTVIPENAAKLGVSNLLPEGVDMSGYSGKTGHDGYGAGGAVITGGARVGNYGWGGAAGTTGFANPVQKTRYGTYTNIGVGDFSTVTSALAGLPLVVTGNAVGSR